MQTILIIDDSSRALQRYQSALGDIQGVSLEKAYSGESALRRAQAVKPDLIIVKLNLADWSGIRVLRTLKQRGVIAPALLVCPEVSAEVERFREEYPYVEFISQEIPGNKLKEEVHNLLYRQGWHRDGTIFDRFKDNFDRFVRHNQRKKRRIIDFYPRKKRMYLEYLPYLLMHNNPRLPGYVENGTGFGISGFNPSENERESFQSLFGVPFQREENTAIQAVYFMGSAGSVAQTPISDLDVWVIAEEGLLEKVREKMESLSRFFSNDLKIELNVYVMTSRQVREGEFGTLSRESSGSTQALLLKEEFYRTMTYIAGKMPFWCVVPPETAIRGLYEHWKKQLNISARFIDFGPVERIPQGELVTGLLWQVLKGVSSPFKSVLKMSLALHYFFRSQAMVPLCEMVKEVIFQEEDEEFADPYLLMTNVAREYAHSRGTADHVRLIDICFLLKIFQNRSIPEFHSRVLKRYLVSHEISRNVVQMARTIEQWPYTIVKQFDRELSGTMLELLEQIIRSQDKIRMKREDFFKIGRVFRLYYHAEQGRIIPLNEVEKILYRKNEYSLYYKHKKWRIYGGLKTMNALNQGDVKPIFIFSDLVFFAASLVYNRIDWKKWRWRLYPESKEVEKDISKLLLSLEKTDIGHDLDRVIQEGDGGLTKVVFLSGFADHSDFSNFLIHTVECRATGEVFVNHWLDFEGLFGLMLKILENRTDSTEFVFLDGKGDDDRNSSFLFLRRGLDFLKSTGERDAVFYHRDQNVFRLVCRVEGEYFLHSFTSLDEFEKWAEGKETCRA